MEKKKIDFKKLGSKGGKSTLQKYGKDHFSKLGKKSMSRFKSDTKI